jgi:hypothetical protein
VCRIYSCTLIEEADNKGSDNTKISTVILIVKNYEDPETDTTLDLM